MSLFISYNREQKGFADEIESSVGAVCPVLRDTNDIAPWGSIEEFMNRIRKADYAVLLISDEYLKSVNCMYEASQLYRDTNWKSRTMYVILGNADTYVYDVSNHERYIRYWQDRKDVLEGQLKSLPSESVDSITAEYKRVCEILLMLGDFLKDIRNTNNLKPDETINAIIQFVSGNPGISDVKVEEKTRDGTLKKTIIDAGFNGVFTEVPYNGSFELANPPQLRLFHMNVVDNEFTFDALKRFLLINIGQYIYSRERIQRFMDENEITLIGLKAVELLRNRCNGDISWLGDELGDLLLYTFLEQVLGAPKIFSKFDIPSDGQIVQGSAGVHLLQPDKAIPSYQLVFGKSRIVGDPQDAIDAAFVTLEAIKKDTTREMRFVESTAFDKQFSPEVAKNLKSLILPTEGQRTTHDTAFGVFLGYSLGLNTEDRSPEQFRADMVEKMKKDIANHIAYITEKINVAKMGRYSFYFYFLPFNNADIEKESIMGALLGLKGGAENG